MKIFYLVLFFFSGICCKSQTTIKLSANDFEKEIARDSIQLLDVRTSSEYASGHLPQSMLADWNNSIQFAERVKFIDKNKPVYIYCLVGGRSTAAAEWMKKNGFSEIRELEGGINAWKKAGKPLEAATPVAQMTMQDYQAIIHNKKVVLVDIGASWCPPCIAMKPILNELVADRRLDFQLAAIDAGVHTDLLTTLKVDPIPVFIIYKNGIEVWRKDGVATKEELIKQLNKAD